MIKKTIVLDVDPVAPDPAVIRRAAAVLRSGGLVAFPTETVYGLGANALDAGAVRGIFAAKARPAYDPLIVHLADVARLPDVAGAIPPLACELAEAFWPGPLTLILPRGPRVPAEVTAGGDTVAVRVPAHPVALALIRAAGVPVAAPSANRFGHISPTRAAHVLADLDGCIDVILDGGATRVGVESTVLSLITSPPAILRPGGVSREALARILGDVCVVDRPVLSTEAAPSPGTLMQHYAPRAEVTLYRGPDEAILPAMREAVSHLLAQGTHVGLLLAEEDVAAFAGLAVVLEVAGRRAALEDVARQLFTSLRALDRAGVAVILARDFGAAGLGLAIRDRLTRAAGGRVINVTAPSR